jgi:hypothetical protein
MRQASTEAKAGKAESGDLGAKTGAGFGATNFAQTNRDFTFFCCAWVATLQTRGTLATTTRWPDLEQA